MATTQKGISIMDFTAIIILSVLFSFGIGAWADSYKRSFGAWFVVSVIVSPIIAGIILMIIGDAGKECPVCRETIGSNAVLCKHCGADFKELDDAETATQKENNAIEAERQKTYQKEYLEKEQLKNIEEDKARKIQAEKYKEENKIKEVKRKADAIKSDLVITNEALDSHGVLYFLAWVIHILAIVGVNCKMAHLLSGGSYFYQFSFTGSLSLAISLLISLTLLGVFRNVSLTAKYQIALYSQIKNQNDKENK